MGRVRRQSPYAYDVINAHSFAEGAGLQLLSEPRWLQQAFRVIGSEQERHRVMAQNEQRAKRDGRYGAAVLKGR